MYYKTSRSVFMYRYIKLRRRFVEGGNDVLKAVISYPEIEGGERISAFYERLAKNCEAWCEAVCFPSLLKEQTASRRTRHVCPLYRFSAEVTEDSETVISVRISASLTKGGDEPRQTYESTQIWNAKSQLIVK
jgi:hypothetical protein